MAMDISIISGKIIIMGLRRPLIITIRATIAKTAATMITGNNTLINGFGAGLSAAGTTSATRGAVGRGGAGSRSDHVTGSTRYPAMRAASPGGETVDRDISG